MEQNPLTERRPVDEDLIQEITKKIVENFHPNRVILFGSRARGDFRPDSDIDICVEMESSETRLQRRLQIARLFSRRWWSMDILAYTPAEMAARRNSLFSIVPEIEREGRILYAR
jgi:predicted nucleotidyltransferase